MQHDYGDLEASVLVPVLTLISSRTSDKLFQILFLLQIPILTSSYINLGNDNLPYQIDFQ